MTTTPGDTRDRPSRPTPPARVGGSSAPAAPVRRSALGSVAGRAALALALLVGYVALAAGIVGGLAVLAVEAFLHTGSSVSGGKLAVFAALVAAATGRAVLAVGRRRDDAEADGVLVPRSEQPELWRLVDEVSLELGVAPPDDLRIVEDVNASVHQDTRLLGLVGGARHMGLGAGLLQVLTVDQLRGVVAHELGHDAGGDTRLSALVHRASATIDDTVLHLGPQSLLGRLFALYARLYHRVSLAVRRRQELRADEGTVRLVGRRAHESGLREAVAAGTAWSFFVHGYVVPLWDAGTAPRDLYAGFRAMLADPVRQEELAAVRAADDAPGDPYDSHPRLSARVAHAASVPDRTPPGDLRPARALLTDPQSLEERVTAQVNARTLDRVPDQRYELGDSLDPGPYVAWYRDEAGTLSRATAVVDGGPRPAGLGRTLALVEQGRDVELVVALTGDRREVGEQVRRTDLGQLVRSRSLRSGRAWSACGGRARVRGPAPRLRERLGAAAAPARAARPAQGRRAAGPAARGRRRAAGPPGRPAARQQRRRRTGLSGR